MPTGNTEWPEPSRSPALTPPMTPDTPLGQTFPRSDGPGVDLWRNFTLPADDATWPGGIAVVNFGGPIQVLEIVAIAAEPLWIGWSGTVSPEPGGYQLYHPGDGQLVEVVPDVSQFWITTENGLRPADRVEVIGRAGRYGGSRF